MPALILRFRARALMTSFGATLSVCIFLSLSGCGGNGSIGHTESSKTPAPVATNEFLNLVKEASCAEHKNRLLLIDQQYVLWDRSGNCADAAYAQSLYGATPKNLLCSHADTIAGPRTTCSEASVESLFKTMIANLDKADLGLGSAHQVQSIAIPNANSNAINFKALPAPFYHGAALDYALIKDKQAWDIFWNASGSKASANLIMPDFNAKMVLTKFYKTVNDCSITRFLKVSSDGQKLHASYFDEERVSITRCDLENTSVSTPMQMIELPTLDLAVELQRVNGALISYQSVVSGMHSAIGTARNIVIRDQANWQQLWQEHQAGTGNATTPPAIDFSKKMLIAVFLGTQASGCSGIQDLRIWRDTGKLVATHYDVTPGPDSICTANITSPFHVAEVDLSTDTVEFIGVPSSTP
ncbi:protease complex subunit PrcB family protein [Undibacterium flavidum]|uniref:Protease complex subunit PrcB family protein n=1 Tax=Undibacterium flavidum TaxID=2762297 RepID=A0ABR6YGE8_9BURK|nr:protease complex subunit PrcB family protein [Undibacterium flavidum]MBC3875608.1 protease complex subunit PrcB family protein [Undibacterium flavidum]